MNSFSFGAESSAEKCLENMDRIFMGLEKKNIKVHPSCRFSIFRKNFEEFYSKVIVGDEESESFNLPGLLEGYRDYCELKLIYSSNKLMSGNILNSMDKNRTARDIQFQLSFAAHLELAGYSLIIQEPDFLIEKNGMIYSVAAKRLSGKSSVYNNIVKAEQQILNHSYPGFIALSVERLMDEKDFLLYLNDPDQGSEICYRLMYKLIASNFNSKHFVRNDQVRALLFSFSMGCIAPDLEPGYSSAFTYFSVKEPESKYGKEVEDFFSHYCITDEDFFSV
ncbi:hypothetical protein C161_07908 [Paenibacillus sp. FSL R5-192]|uniref:hypothetical protein n=1 Tax=Paenibacillus sp. FSL R5-192 TaxID=1226754 RepID=UPI0003E1CC10|nr:hypothetical protein [Paenibacillus sp. FSL R5-192]ETT38032.1 hypothetical protein C161_07908 [Paenibacillus sp. FSL R5-192]